MKVKGGIRKTTVSLTVLTTYFPFVRNHGWGGVFTYCVNPDGHGAARVSAC
jgi:hypothetical protein